MSTVNYTQAQRLAALGLTPTYPGMVWAHTVLAGHGIDRWELQYWATERTNPTVPEWHAAPAYLEALDWAEREHGWRWERIAEGWWGESGSSVFDREDTGRVESASELLDAVLDAIEAAQAAKESR